MSNKQSLWAMFTQKFHRLIAKLLIRLKVIKQRCYSAQELNDALVTNFPHTLNIELPSGKGELVVLKAQLAMPISESKLHIQLNCSFTVRIVNHEIYRCHLDAFGTVTPCYDVVKKSIRLKDMKLKELRLIKDDFYFVESTSQLIGLFLPGPFNTMLSNTMQLSLAVLKGVIPSDLLNYLNLYSSANKQSVLDFHHSDIENKILSEVEQDDWQYVLDETDFEEQIFAELGQEVLVENGQLVFKFHH